MSPRYSRSRTLGIAIFGTFCVGGALAEDHPADLRQALTACSTVKEPAERLGCFDKLAAGPALPVLAAPPLSAPESPQAFGLSDIQKAPRQAQTQAITGEIVGMGHAANGRLRLTLDNGQSWELEDAADSLLAVGNSVTVQRASLGSFLMTTPMKVTHRVRRVK